jgi:putative phage-type endonuclease
LLTAEQVAARRHGVGGSDVGAILGFNPWRSAYDVYLDKLGVHPNPIDDDDPPEVVRWGNLLEPVVAAEVARRRAPTVQVVESNGAVVHPDHEWMRVNVDRYLASLHAPAPGVLEVKTTNAFQAKEWRDGQAPAAAIAQLCWAYAVTGYRWGWAAGLVGGQRLAIADVPYDGDLVDSIVQRCGEFWHDHVLARKPPPVVGQDRKLIQTLYAVGGEGEIEVDEEISVLTEHYTRYRGMESYYRGKKRDVETAIRARLGDHDAAIDPLRDSRPVVRLVRVDAYEVAAHTRQATRRLYVDP